MQNYPGINPGAEILLRVKGVTYVKIVLEILDKVEGQAIDLSEVSPNYYRYLRPCITTGNIPHLYDLLQHKAWQKTGSATGGMGR